MKRNIITIAVTVVSAVSIFGAVAYNSNELIASQVQLEQTKETALKSTKVISRPQVDVINVTEHSYQAEVVGFGEAKPRFNLTFSVEVSGRVDRIHASFESGQVVKKGSVLAVINSTQYEQALAEASSNLAQAKLDLLEEERKGVQAKSEWNKSGVTGEPASPLVLREPQLVKAKMALDNAQKAKNKALQDLNNTQVKAPFDALIVSRSISPGSYVQIGSELASLYSIEEMEVEIPLSGTQWENLGYIDNQSLSKAPKDWLVELSSSDGKSAWKGYVRRVEQHLNSNTRQRSLIVAVDKPLEQKVDLYPGTFVKVTVQGASVDGLWELPASAISQQGEIWVIDKDSRLQSYAADKQFERGDLVYVSKLSSDQDISKVVKRPLSSYKKNMLVSAKFGG